MHQPSNSYNILKLPINYQKSFLDFTTIEIHDYYSWFMNIKHNRFEVLCQFLFSDFQTCLKEENLNVVEMFLINSVSTIPKSVSQYNKEIENIPLHLRFTAKPDNYVLDEKTISICYDIGIFMGELIICLDEQIFWKLETSENYADYGQPILAKKKSKLTLNPFRIVKNAAARIHEGNYPDKWLISVFNAWKKGFMINR